MEKPITSNRRELLDLMQVAKDQKVMILEAVNFLYNPVFSRLKEEIQKIGRIKIVSLNYSQYSSRYDAFIRGKQPPVFDWRKSGGCLVDINIYNVNLVLGLFGKPRHHPIRWHLIRSSIWMEGQRRWTDQSGNTGCIMSFWNFRR